MTAKTRKPPEYSERQNLRREGSLPDLYKVTRPPTVAQTTKSEVSDLDIGLPHDPIAQRRAEDYIRAALAFRTRQADRAEQEITGRRKFVPVAVRIAAVADEESQAEQLFDVVEILTPHRTRLDA